MRSRAVSIHEPDTFKPSQSLEEDRKQGRRGLYLPVFLHVPGRMPSLARLADISENGCRILSGAKFTTGMQVNLEVLTFSRFDGRVVWQTRQGCGVDFSIPITRAEVAYVVELAVRGC